MVLCLCSHTETTHFLTDKQLPSHYKGMKRSRNNAMSALDDSFQNDSAFQILLNSQRELLNRLKFEKGNQGKSPYKNIVGQKSDNMGNMTVSQNRISCATNVSIGLDNHENDHVLHCKRSSIGVGNDKYILPDMEPNKLDAEEGYSYTFLFDHEEGEVTDHKRRKLNFNHNGHVSKQRRRSTLGFLQYIFEKHEGQPASMETVRQMDCKEQDNGAEQPFEGDTSEDDDHDIYMVNVDDEEDENLKNDDCKTSKATEQVRKYLVSLEHTMEKSQDSQQAIHDWDRKMGLKRSHSKTMRLSSRSRKKIRNILKTEISFVNTSKFP